MDLYINNSKSSESFAPGASVSDLLESLRAKALEDGHAILSVTCDGIDVCGDRVTEMLERSLSDVGRVDISTGRPDQLVGDALAHARTQLAATGDFRQQAIDAFGRSATTDGVAALGKCLSHWLEVNDTINKSFTLLGMTQSGIIEDQEKIAELLAPVMERLNEIRVAMEAADYVGIADILEYEFDDVQQNWHACIDMVLGHIDDAVATATTQTCPF